jgi:hypothetical protein
MIAFGIGYPEAFMRRSLNEISITHFLSNRKQKDRYLI